MTRQAFWHMADLRLLAHRYERLAELLEGAPGALSDMPLEVRRQAGLIQLASPGTGLHRKLQ